MAGSSGARQHNIGLDSQYSGRVGKKQVLRQWMSCYCGLQVLVRKKHLCHPVMTMAMTTIVVNHSNIIFNNWDENKWLPCHGAGWGSTSLQMYLKVWLQSEGQGLANVYANTNSLDLLSGAQNNHRTRKQIICWIRTKKSKSSTLALLSKINQSKCWTCTMVLTLLMPLISS